MLGSQLPLVSYPRIAVHKAQTMPVMEEHQAQCGQVLDRVRHDPVQNLLNG